MIGDGVGGLRHVGIKKIHFVIAERPLCYWSSVSSREPGNLHTRGGIISWQPHLMNSDWKWPGNCIFKQAVQIYVSLIPEHLQADGLRFIWLKTERYYRCAIGGRLRTVQLRYSTQIEHEVYSLMQVALQNKV